MDATKSTLRRHQLQLRAGLTEGARVALSDQLCQAVFQSELWRRATTIALFESLSDEVRTAQLIQSGAQSGKRILLPVVEKRGQPLIFREAGERRIKGHFGVLVPPPSQPTVPTDQIDLALFPGLAFTQRGERLGYGGGYYDRTFAEHPTIRRVGLFFAFQQLPRLPTSQHDLTLDGVFTELGFARCR